MNLREKQERDRERLLFVLGAATLGFWIGRLVSQPKAVPASAQPVAAPATPESVVTQATASTPSTALSSVPAAQTTSSSPPYGPSATLFAGTMTEMITSPTSGPVNLTAPTGGTITSLSSSDAKLLGTAANGATSLALSQPSVGLSYDSSSSGASGNVTVNWTDSTGASQQSVVPVSITT